MLNLLFEFHYSKSMYGKEADRQKK